MTAAAVLDPRAAVALMLERGLVDRSEVADGELRVIPASRRNHNFHVLRTQGPSYILKQGVGRERRMTVAHEAAVYEFLASLERPGLRALLPRVIAYAPADCVLLLELVSAGESFERRTARRRRFSPAHARRLAQALATIHLTTAEAAAELSGSLEFRRGMPRALAALRRPSVAMLGALSNGCMLAVRMIQSSDGFVALLDEVAGAWRPGCLVHGDLRLDNCVLPPGPPRRGGLRIVDWELARWGDPCWDAGAVLAWYLRTWLLACPISGETPPEAALRLGRYRFSEMQRAAGAFWATYRDEMSPAGSVSLRRTTQFAAVHLLQSMVEELQTSVVLTGRAVCLAQLALNLLEHPDQAAIHFLAIPAER
jgi:aminoglycoside phosphotransferase (APT) family kinase protein